MKKKSSQIGHGLDFDAIYAIDKIVTASPRQ